MSTKTGITLELKQNERDVTGTYHAVKVGALGEETHDGTVTGKVKGDEVALEFSDPQLDMTPAITVKLTESDGVRKLGGYIQPDASGIGTKYYFEEQKGKK